MGGHEVRVGGVLVAWTRIGIVEKVLGGKSLPFAEGLASPVVSIVFLGVGAWAWHLICGLVITFTCAEFPLCSLPVLVFFVEVGSWTGVPRTFANVESTARSCSEFPLGAALVFVQVVCSRSRREFGFFLVLQTFFLADQCSRTVDHSRGLFLCPRSRQICETFTRFNSFGSERKFRCSFVEIFGRVAEIVARPGGRFLFFLVLDVAVVEGDLNAFTLLLAELGAFAHLGAGVLRTWAQSIPDELGVDTSLFSEHSPPSFSQVISSL